MDERSKKILVVEPDGEVLEILVASLTRRFDAQITCVPDAGACLDTEMLDPHDLVITELELDDEDGLQLAEHLLALSQRPVILLANALSCEEAVEALRMGLRDVFRKPFPIEELLDATHRALAGFDLRRRRAIRYRRMRELVRRAIRERRELNQRLDLICRDLVQAQRRLVRRVMAIEARPTSPSLDSV